jgi:CRP/FNR family transcriptional regulator, anaerobic regulatory protein
MEGCLSFKIGMINGMKKELAPLIAHMRRFIPLAGADVEKIERAFEMKFVKDKEHILFEGDICREKYFIVTGCLRKYVNTEKGDKQIFQFSIENWWMTDYTSLESGRPSTCNIQAVEDSVLICISRERLEGLYRDVPMVETYFRKILQRAYEASLTRIHLIFSYSGEERYRKFISSFPEFVQRIPQYMLASYLGFTPEFLSKLRNRRS